MKEEPQAEVVKEIEMEGLDREISLENQQETVHRHCLTTEEVELHHRDGDEVGLQEDIGESRDNHHSGGNLEEEEADSPGLRRGGCRLDHLTDEEEAENPGGTHQEGAAPEIEIGEEPLITNLLHALAAHSFQEVHSTIPGVVTRADRDRLWEDTTRNTTEGVRRRQLDLLNMSAGIKEKPRDVHGYSKTRRITSPILRRGT